MGKTWDTRGYRWVEICALICGRLKVSNIFAPSVPLGLSSGGDEEQMNIY